LGRLRADAGAEKENERRGEEKQELGAGGACADVSPESNWTRRGHAAVRLKQKSPEEQDRQDDRNSDDDDLYETHDLNLKFVGGLGLRSSEGCILSVHCEKCQRYEPKWPAARLILPEQQNFRRLAGR
jgi:hypothetical protein